MQETMVEISRQREEERICRASIEVEVKRFSESGEGAEGSEDGEDIGP